MKPYLSQRRLERALITTAEQFRLPILLITSPSRRQDVCRARDALCYALRQATDVTTIALGLHLGRDHSTVLSAVERAQALRAIDQDYAGAIAAIVGALL
jgi:chromosomal replication initiation ATPase DnaA